MTSYVECIGFVGSTMIGISFIPQTYKVVKNNDTKSISRKFVFVNIVSASLMTIYGYILKIYPVIIANSSVLINNLIILYFTGIDTPMQVDIECA